MEMVLALLIIFIVSIIISYKMGVNDESKRAKIRQCEIKENTINRANRAGTAAVNNWLSKHKQ